jgi:hypothetical protein
MGVFLNHQKRSRSFPPQEDMKDLKFSKYKDAKGKIIKVSEPYEAGTFSSGYDHVQRGEYECSKGTMYFRSKWEANYALYLDFLVKQKQIKGWEYEPDRFVFESIKFGTRSFIPDFKVINNDGKWEYHEVKGFLDGRSKTKLKRIAKYFPNIKLELIDKDYYNTLKRQCGKLLNWY